jgi:hypothetical protein
MDSAQGLKATLRVLALSAPGQLKLYPAGECANCRVSLLYNEWVEHFNSQAYLAGIGAAQREALARVDAVSKLANEAPCHEPKYLTGGEAFKELRSAAKAALDAFGWTNDAPDPKYLWWGSESAAIFRARQRKERTARLRARAPGVPAEDFGDIPDFDPRRLTTARFRTVLAQVPWFQNLGKPHPRDDHVERLESWGDWGGPESKGGSTMGCEGSVWQDDVFPVDAAAHAPVEQLWNEVTSECFQAVARSFHEDLDGDPWHGPSNAAGQAAWLAATIACCLQAGQPIPRNALRQWAWFARGHWPCKYSENDDLDFDGDRESVEALERAWLVVY